MRPSAAIKTSRMLSDPSEWVARYGDYLFRYAIMRVRNREAAENLVQETFLAALQSRASYSGRSTERTWMTGILKHKMIDQYRKAIKEKPLSDISEEDNERVIEQFYDGQGHYYDRICARIPNPGEMLYSKEFWEILSACLQSLPERTATVFVMRELDGYSAKEICRALDMTPANLWVTLHRARLQLRKLLEKSWFQGAQDGKRRTEEERIKDVQEQTANSENPDHDRRRWLRMRCLLQASGAELF